MTLSRVAKWLVGVGLCGLAGCAGPGTEGPDEKTPPPEPYYGDDGDDLGKADTAKRPATTEPIGYGVVKTTELTPSEQYRAFTFSGHAGQLVDLYADGLDGLDTVLYLYRLSPANGRPYGWPIAANDDTPAPGWILSSNAEANPWSSSVNDFALPVDGSYALVVTSFWQLYDGQIEVVVKTPEVAKTCGGFANLHCPEGQICWYQPYTCTIPDMAGSCMENPADSGFSCSPPNPNVDNRVCGCDGNSYVDACHARMLGASVAAAGPCVSE